MSIVIKVRSKIQFGINMKAFFYSKNKFQPVYFWITLFCSLAFVMFMLKLFKIGDISDTLVIGVLAFIEAWVLLYNIDKKNNHG